MAASYPNDLRSIYQQAANDLRAPYWDWALEPWLPSAVLPETITVNAPSETGTVSKTIDNPLFTYRFPKEVLQGKFGAFSPTDRMYRCPNPNSANQNLYGRNYKSWVVSKISVTMATSHVLMDEFYSIVHSPWPSLSPSLPQRLAQVVVWKLSTMLFTGMLAAVVSS